MFASLITKAKVLVLAGVTAGAIGVSTQSASARGWSFDFGFRPVYAAPVVVEQPVCAPAVAPVVVAPAPVCAPAPVVVYEAPRPVYYYRPEYRGYDSFRFGWGRR